MQLRLVNTAAGLGLVILIVYLLHIGKNLVLPLLIALVIWYIILQFTSMFQKIHICHHRLPYWICLTLSIIIAAVIVYLFVMLLTYSIANTISEGPRYQEKLQTITHYVSGMSHGKFNINELIGKINLSQLFSTFALIISDILSNFVLILIYLLFLLLESKTFNQKISGICKTEKQLHKVNRIIERIHGDVNSYLKIKTTINGLAGLLSYIVLLCFGIESAEFWGMFIFLLHYIPYIGPIAAVILVLIAVSIQINSLLVFLILASILAVIQFAVGNLLEPKLMGTRLNLSPIVILVSLAFWGYIWGIVGMFLSVPVMVIINIVFANFPQTRPISVVLSANGSTAEAVDTKN